jgi:hypothetical protein
MGQLEVGPPWGDHLVAHLAHPVTHMLRVGPGQVAGQGQVPHLACAAPAPGQQRRLQLQLQQLLDPCQLHWVCGVQWACCRPLARWPWVGLQERSWAPGLTCCAPQGCCETTHRAGCCCCWRLLLLGWPLLGCSALLTLIHQQTTAAHVSDKPTDEPCG